MQLEDGKTYWNRERTKQVTVFRFTDKSSTDTFQFRSVDTDYSYTCEGRLFTTREHDHDLVEEVGVPMLAGIPEAGKWYKTREGSSVYVITVLDDNSTWPVHGIEFYKDSVTHVRDDSIEYTLRGTYYSEDTCEDDLVELMVPQPPPPPESVLKLNPHYKDLKKTSSVTQPCVGHATFDQVEAGKWYVNRMGDYVFILCLLEYEADYPARGIQYEGDSTGVVQDFDQEYTIKGKFYEHTDEPDDDDLVWVLVDQLPPPSLEILKQNPNFGEMNVEAIVASCDDTWKETVRLIFDEIMMNRNIPAEKIFRIIAERHADYFLEGREMK